MAVNDEGLEYIAKTTLNSTTSVTFSNIPQTYKHLMIVVTGLGNYSGTSTLDITCRVNGNASSNYGEIVSFRSGTSYSYSGTANSNHTRAGNMCGNSDTNQRGLNIIYFYDYASTTARKQIVGESYNTLTTGSGGRPGYYAGTYISTANITEIQLQGENGTYQFTNGTYAVLYGLKGL